MSCQTGGPGPSRAFLSCCRVESWRIQSGPLFSTMSSSLTGRLIRADGLHACPYISRIHFFAVRACIRAHACAPASFFPARLLSAIDSAHPGIFILSHSNHPLLNRISPCVIPLFLAARSSSARAPSCPEAASGTSRYLCGPARLSISVCGRLGADVRADACREGVSDFQFSIIYYVFAPSFFGDPPPGARDSTSY
jgi:hypothetical protein